MKKIIALLGLTVFFQLTSYACGGGASANIIYPNSNTITADQVYVINFSNYGGYGGGQKTTFHPSRLYLQSGDEEIAVKLIHKNKVSETFEQYTVQATQLLDPNKKYKLKYRAKKTANKHFYNRVYLYDEERTVASNSSFQFLKDTKVLTPKINTSGDKVSSITLNTTSIKDRLFLITINGNKNIAYYAVGHEKGLGIYLWDSSVLRDELKTISVKEVNPKGELNSKPIELTML